MLLKEKQEIEKWLNQYHIKNYDLIEDEKYGYIINVNNNVYLSGLTLKLKRIEVKFNIIEGYFDCGYNQLKSLEGCPEIVKGYFSCAENQIENLLGCPKLINDDFYANNNKIKNLKDGPEIVGGIYYCDNNLLTIKELKYLPKKIKTNLININFNKKLKDLQTVDNFEELKRIVTIYQEKENIDLLINNKGYNISNKKIKKI